MPTLPNYTASPGVNLENLQAMLHDQTAQNFKAQYLPMLLAGDASEPVVGKLSAAIQEFYIAGAVTSAEALTVECVTAANAVAATLAAEVFAGSIQKVIDSLNPPPPPPEQQAIISNALVVQIGEKQQELAALQEQASVKAMEIQTLTEQLAQAMPPLQG